MTETEFVRKMKNIGVETYIVGGWVRDHLRGSKAKDKDYLLCGCLEEDFQSLFPTAEKVGKSFPVYLLKIDDERCEVAFARREKKQGTGYRGFEVEYDASITVEDDLYRRDTTMNSIAIRLTDGKIIDPYGGRADIEAGRIRAVSKHFCDDPVRALRAARQAAELGFEIEEETYMYMKACSREMKKEPVERFLEELRKALATEKPSVFFRSLKRADLLKITFPELAALIGKSQPKDFHPEGDAFEHTMLILDKVSANTASITARFAGLAHDLGKGETQKEMLPHHYGHEIRGLEVLQLWDNRMTMPKEWIKAASFVIKEHMRAPRLEKVGKIANLLLSITKSGLSIEEFNIIIRADHGSLPAYLEKGRLLIREMNKVSGREAPENLSGKAIGEWLMRKRVEILLDFRLRCYV